jgi:serine/threonine-protein kinase HipA
MGALTYHPPNESERDDRFLDLHELGRNAEQILAGDPVEVLPQLAQAGGSPGGARPKVLVGIQDNQIVSGEGDLPDGFLHWIVKFAAREDARDAGPVEYAYALMACAAGIDMPETRLFELKHGHNTRRYFAVRRFDREPGNRRIHVHTFGNLIHTNFRIPSTDYADLFKATRSLTRNHQDMLKLFRLMVFNIAAHNRDDHAKNFAFMLDGDTGEWSLTPAYDLTCSPGPGGEHTMTVAGEGKRPTREHCLQLAGQTGIDHREGASIFDEINSAIADWRKFADQACCARKITATVRAKLRSL